MALADLLKNTSSFPVGGGLDRILRESGQEVNVKQEITEERINQQMDNLRKQIAFYREYPDLLIDRMAGFEDTPGKFKFYFYQRIFVRVVMRHRIVYATFPRAFSKSFLSMMVLMLRAILYPGSELFVTTGGKEQAASITVAKIEQICKFIPAMSNELRLGRGETKNSKDDVNYKFKNGSVINILAARESSRGQRRTGGLMEECVLIDQTALNEIIIPTTNVVRRLPDGSSVEEEKVNQSQVYITTAGWKESFAYDRLIEVLIDSVIDPDDYMVIGGTYRTPVKEGLLGADFVNQLKLQGTFKEESFGREYESRWSGGVEGAYFSAEKFDSHRVLQLPEKEYSAKSSKNAYYVLGVDVGRTGCTTEVAVFKVTPQPNGAAVKSLVNLYTKEATHFEEQAIYLKKLYYKYKARIIAVDANGLGVGLVDFLTTSQIDPETNDILPPFGVFDGTNEEAKNQYKKIRGANVEENALYLIKANAPINTEAYAYTQTQLLSGKIKFLIDEQEAKTKLMSTKVGMNMSFSQIADYLYPYQNTTLLKEQLLNLVQENEGQNIILKQNSKSIKKDKFSAFIYGLYFIKQEEEKKNKRRGRAIKDFMFFS